MSVSKFKYLIFTICILITMCLSGCCNKGNTLEDASEAYKSGDFKKGDSEALVNLAFMHYCGLHVEQDHEKAFDYYLKAAKKNNVTAQFSLGTMYENGEGTASNLSEAYFWYSIAEKQFDMDSQKLRRELEQKLSTTTINNVRERVKVWQPED